MREIVESFSAAVAVVAGVVGFTRALAAADLAHVTARPVTVAVARTAQRMTVVALVALVAVWR